MFIVIPSTYICTWNEILWPQSHGRSCYFRQPFSLLSPRTFQQSMPQNYCLKTAREGLLCSGNSGLGILELEIPHRGQLTFLEELPKPGHIWLPLKWKQLQTPKWSLGLVVPLPMLRCCWCVFNKKWVRLLFSSFVCMSRITIKKLFFLFVFYSFKLSND